MFQELLNYQSYFFTFGILWMIGFMYWGKKRVDSIFQGVEKNKQIFREKRVSGYSKKSTFTRIGGARNALDVIVTDTELCVKGIFLPFSVIGLFYDLTLRIKLDEIVEVSSDGKTVEIEFTNNKGTRGIVLNMNNSDQFVHAVKG